MHMWQKKIKILTGNFDECVRRPEPLIWCCCCCVSNCVAPGIEASPYIFKGPVGGCGGILYGGINCDDFDSSLLASIISTTKI